MKRFVMVTAAFAAAALSGVALAQTSTTVVTPGTQPGTIIPNQIVTPGTAVIDPRFVDPRVNFFDPRLQFNGGSLGFTPGVTTGNFFIPANGDGFFFANPWGPWGYTGPMVDARGAWMQRPPAALGGTVPIAGLNSPPLARGSARVTRIVDGGSGSGYDYASLAVADALTGNDQPPPAGGVIDPGTIPTRVAVRGGTTVVRTQPIAPTHVAVGTIRTPPTVQVFEPVQTRVAGSTTVIRTTENVVNVASVDPQQIRLADHMEDVMDNRPLTEGTVVSLENGGVVVRYLNRGEVVVERFPRGNVFFFHNGGTLATASTGGRMLQPGDQVLIPVGTTVTIERQSVAGSRQEINGSTRVRVRRRPAK